MVTFHSGDSPVTYNSIKDIVNTIIIDPLQETVEVELWKWFVFFIYEKELSVCNLEMRDFEQFFQHFTALLKAVYEWMNF